MQMEGPRLLYWGEPAAPYRPAGGRHGYKPVNCETENIFVKNDFEKYKKNAIIRSTQQQLATTATWRFPSTHLILTTHPIQIFCYTLLIPDISSRFSRSRNRPPLLRSIQRNRGEEEAKPSPRRSGDAAVGDRVHRRRRLLGARDVPSLPHLTCCGGGPQGVVGLDRAARWPGLLL